MSDTGEQRSEIVTHVQKELESLKIEEERNNIELVLEHHDFDFHKTINSFVDGTSRKFVDNWKLCAWKKKQKHCVTSTPKMPLKIDSSSSLTHLSACKDLADRVNRLLKEKQSDTISGDVLMAKIQFDENSIREYEKKMESSNDPEARRYYIQSAVQVREQIREFLQIYKEQMSGYQ